VGYIARDLLVVGQIAGPRAGPYDHRRADCQTHETHPQLHSHG
jgi:hypothetical protein